MNPVQICDPTPVYRATTLYVTTYRRPAPMDEQPPALVHTTTNPHDVIPFLSMGFPGADLQALAALLGAKPSNPDAPECHLSIRLPKGGILHFEVVSLRGGSNYV